MMLKKHIRLMEREAAYMGPFGITKTGESNYFFLQSHHHLWGKLILSLYNIAFASIFLLLFECRGTAFLSRLHNVR